MLAPLWEEVRYFSRREPIALRVEAISMVLRLPSAYLRGERNPRQYVECGA